MSAPSLETILAEFSANLSVSTSQAVKALDLAVEKARAELDLLLKNRLAVEPPQMSASMMFSSWFAENREKIIAWAKAHPSDDFVYEVKDPNKCGLLSYVPEAIPYPVVLTGPPIVQGVRELCGAKSSPVAGSGPVEVHHLVNALQSAGFPAGNLHVSVDTKTKSVSELLLGFHSPQRRVAQDLRGTFWVSAQCLAKLV